MHALEAIVAIALAGLLTEMLLTAYCGPKS